ncbi:diaminopimelate decarboxylase [Pseudobacteroides cellulosolvens]|uniref:Diaminopimelate decarboxylase n=1 Tax=Pseudobacteroides cellulosolvens ATCC 35603 = DSM 2933 TaxID=398512 RepID=A0A0L6JNU0_9FIRM|nr:diaminopimelate decarboxylase [Pseudobacteroides cellulosolvens]KNY27449.1 diaminopimelate decarboxylase [Pseudobacteroides cellulosolvens ATCC 35603 = DSM 2933]
MNDNCVENKIFDYDFYNRVDVQKLIHQYGSPLYIYDENILRKSCREMKNLMQYPWFVANYSIKANSNMELLKIIRDEGLNADAISPGEIHVLLEAGFEPSQIFYVGNNVSVEEMKYAIDNGVLVSVDSLSQLEAFGKINKGGKVSLRFNPGVGAGHHEKVVTAGNNTKFGIDSSFIEEVKQIAEKYSLKVAGVNQHIGSLFLDGKPYIEGVKSLLAIAGNFQDLEFIDMGGGFGIPYKKQSQERLDLSLVSRELEKIIIEWMKVYGREVQIKIEPGRYIVAECGVLLGTVHSIKTNYGKRYVGTDVGFNVLMRPVMYDSYHEIEFFRKGKLLNSDKRGISTIVGNICETGDILAKDREIPDDLMEDDIVAVLDAGAYGYSMCSNYNLRLRPAEVLICEDGLVRLIRRRDTFDDLMAGYR